MVFLKQFAKWIVGIAAITAACLLGANKLEASFERSLVCGREFAPITRRAAVDIRSYEVDNMALARSAHLLSSVGAQQVQHEPYRRCGNERLDSDIVGVRSSFFVAIPPQLESCRVMAALKYDLESSGWSVYPHTGTYADAPTGARGYAHAIQAERGHAQLELRIDDRDTRLAVVADHNAPVKFVKAAIDPQIQTNFCA